ncbi:hypothetical protein FDP41_011587 [Naegleria fowleri]|uniref:Uncharacterized protein n=1 Tax=Naegleria fowleri TaxID=5763 RepID=A0A6A5BZH1_NAEFO|nr:uncharacterized protein FDP41_011587 [Naegleria fowleri]KAF0982657.1 hypothetical protein FDP41_011587 [Naegleria fowleri]
MVHKKSTTTLHDEEDPRIASSNSHDQSSPSYKNQLQKILDDYSSSSCSEQDHRLTEHERISNDLDVIFGSSSSENTKSYSILKSTTTNGNRYKSKKIRRSGTQHSDNNFIISSGFGKFSFKFRVMVVCVIFSTLFGAYFLSGFWSPHASKSATSSSESVFVGEKVGNTFGRHLKLILEQYKSGGGIIIIGDDHDSNLILSMQQNSISASKQAQHALLYSRVRQIHHHEKSQHEDMSKTSLILENVCMNHRGEFLFFVPSQEFYEQFYKPLIGLSSNGPFAYFQTTRFGKRGAARMKFIIGHKIPKSSQNNNIRWIDRPTIAMMRFAANHIGHLFADNLVALVDLAMKFEINLHESLILFLDEIFYRTTNGDNSCSSDTSRQVHLPIVNPSTKKHLWCEEELASQFEKKPQAVKTSLVWTQMLSSLPILQKCSYVVSTSETSHSVANREEMSQTDAASLYYRIEKAPCPIDDSFSRELTNKQRSTILSIQDIETQSNDRNQQPFKDKLENSREQIDTCFRHLIIGVGDRSIMSQQPHRKHSQLQFSELPIQQLRKTILSNLGIHSSSSMDSPLVNILIDYQSIDNPHEIATSLETHLKEDALLLNHLKNINIYKDMKLENLNEMALVELFSQTHIFLSNATSSYAYLSLFMPTSSHLLLSPNCDSVVEVSKNPQPYKCSLVGVPSLHFLNAMSHLTLIHLSDCVSKISQQVRVELNAEKASQIISMILKLRIIV